MRMGFHAQAEMTGLVYGGLQFFESKLFRLRIAAMRQHGSAGKNLDVIGAIVSKLPNHLSDFPRTVGLAVMQIPRERDVGTESRSRTSAASNGYISASHKQARTDDVAPIDGVTQSHIAESTVNADVAHGSEPRLQHGAGVRNGFQRHLCCGFAELLHGFGIARAIGQMSVAVDESRKDSHLAEIDDLRIGRNGYVFAECLDFAVADENGLIGGNGTG